MDRAIFCWVYLGSDGVYFLLATPLLGTVRDAVFSNFCATCCFGDVLFVMMFVEF